MFTFLRKLKKEILSHEPLVRVIIHKEHLLHNLHFFQKKYSGLSFAPVLRSNAYGHGLLEVANILKNEEIPFFVVDSLFEAKVLRRGGIKKPILIIGYTSAKNIADDGVLNTAFTITSLEHLQMIDKKLRYKTDFHLKLDTGMHRQGVMLKESDKAIEIIRNNKRINLIGLCTHFADADNENDNFTNMQIKLWNEAVDIFKKHLHDLKYFHCANSAGAYYSQKAFGNVARLGIALYGINPSKAENLPLKPILSMESVISSVREIGQGEHVGYNLTYQAGSDRKIATVPAGYFEGVDRRLSGQGFFKVKNVDCPIVGRVSMNITSIDVSSVSGVKEGDKVSIISNNEKDNNSAENIALIAGTIPYEILAHIPSHLRREVV